MKNALMFTATTLTELIEANRNVPRTITYVEGERSAESFMRVA